MVPGPSITRRLHPASGHSALGRLCLAASSVCASARVCLSHLAASALSAASTQHRTHLQPRTASLRLTGKAAAATESEPPLHRGSVGTRETRPRPRATAPAHFRYPAGLALAWLRIAMWVCALSYQATVLIRPSMVGFSSCKLSFINRHFSKDVKSKKEIAKY